MRWHCSTVVKQNIFFFYFRGFNIHATFSLFIFSVSDLSLSPQRSSLSLITSLSLTVAYTNRCLSCFSSTKYQFLAWVWRCGPGGMVLWWRLTSPLLPLHVFLDFLFVISSGVLFFAWFSALNSDWLDQMQGRCWFCIGFFCGFMVVLEVGLPSWWWGW